MADEYALFPPFPIEYLNFFLLNSNLYEQFPLGLKRKVSTESIFLLKRERLKTQENIRQNKGRMEFFTPTGLMSRDGAVSCRLRGQARRAGLFRRDPMQAQRTWILFFPF